MRVRAKSRSQAKKGEELESIAARLGNRYWNLEQEWIGEVT